MASCVSQPARGTAWDMGQPKKPWNAHSTENQTASDLRFCDDRPEGNSQYRRTDSVLLLSNERRSAPLIASFAVASYRARFHGDLIRVDKYVSFERYSLPLFEFVKQSPLRDGGNALDRATFVSFKLVIKEFAVGGLFR